MSYVDWIFALHLLTAATLVGGFVMSWIVVVALRTANTPDATLSLNRVARVGTVVIVVGLLGTIALGIWTAILRPELHPWHGWAMPPATARASSSHRTAWRLIRTATSMWRK